MAERHVVGEGEVVIVGRADKRRLIGSDGEDDGCFGGDGRVRGRNGRLRRGVRVRRVLLIARVVVVIVVPRLMLV